MIDNEIMILSFFYVKKDTFEKQLELLFSKTKISWN